MSAYHITLAENEHLRRRLEEVITRRAEMYARIADAAEGHWQRTVVAQQAEIERLRKLVGNLRAGTVDPI